MKVHATFDDSEIQKLIKEFPKRIKKGSNEAIEKVAAEAATIIRDRTSRGQGVRGKFKGYAKSTRRKGTHQKGRVDLYDKGDMIGAMRSKAKNPFLGIVGFVSIREARKAIWHNKGAGHLPVRLWFDLNNRESKKISKEYKRLLFRYLNRK